MKSVLGCINLWLYVLCFSTFLYSSVRSNLNKGSSAYKKENYDEALQKYLLAETSRPNLPETSFNLGNVYYKTGDYEDALRSYEKATYSKDIELQSKAYYNTGSVLFRMEKLPEAIQFYKKALELNPDDQDAKFNIEFVQKKLKEDIDKKSKQQDEKQNDEKAGDKGDKDNKDKKEQKGEKEKDKKDEKNQGEKDKDKKDEPAEKDKKQGMSKEDAARLLESAGDEKRPKEKANMKIPLFKMPEKDW